MGHDVAAPRPPPKVHVLTVASPRMVLAKTTAEDSRADLVARVVEASNAHGCAVLEASCSSNGLSIDVLGRDVAFSGFGSKPRLALAHLKKAAHIPDDALIVFVDAYDTAFVRGPDDIAQAVATATAEAGVKDDEAAVVFAAERWCWPKDDERARKHPPSPTPYRYLNSGAYAGRKRDVVQLLSAIGFEDADDDQERFQSAFISAPATPSPRIVLDTHCRAFQCHAGEDTGHNGIVGDAVALDDDKHVTNRVTGARPALLHANGGIIMRANMARLIAHHAWFPEPSPLVPRAPGCAR